ncbi:MAG: hypothetical protein JJU28_16005 [Cyclobacteriaceae bacterium]|nr:hypothetical protein [Cyclobacteriaceae bacterium]
MNRRIFIKNSAAVAPSLFFLSSALGLSGCKNSTAEDDRIQDLAVQLLEKWCLGLMEHQTISPGDKTTHGGIYSPGDAVYLGRSADAIYPLLWMAKHTNDQKYVEAAKLVYDWEQNNCWSEELGCWYNDANRPESWKGITVFAAMSKYEAIVHYPELLGEETIKAWKERLYRASEYLYQTLTINFGNINYPAYGTLAFYCLGKLFKEDRYIQRAEELAIGLLPYFTADGLFYGEGGRIGNADGQYPVDLGYNVEESLPALALYAKSTGNKELQSKVLTSLQAHLEFMLPNGGWDNSWGTRSFKWTLWGSRTSDGCHPGYYALAGDAPVFAEAVYRNLKCLEASTANNLLYGGPHEFIHGVVPSIHHTFNHAKALVNLLHTDKPDMAAPENILPRERVYGIKKFDSINTILFSKGPWRGTVTAYNVGYKTEIHGHASGGALTLLYHIQHDMISAASMTEYQRWERFNMLDENKVENFMNLTPRLEVISDDQRIFRNISDFSAKLSFAETEDELIISTISRLVDGDNTEPAEGMPAVFIDYKIRNDDFSMEIALDKPITHGELRFIFPVISSAKDEIILNQGSFIRKNEKGTLTLQSNYPLKSLIPENQRVYNFIPGLQAFPLAIDCSEIHKETLILTFTV